MKKINKPIAGIYKLQLNEHIYIGQSVNIEKRIKIHKKELEKNIHSNRFMQSVYNKYRKNEQWEIKEEIVEELPLENFDTPQLHREELTDLEQHYMNYYNADLNLQPAYINSITAEKKRKIDYPSNCELYHPAKGNIQVADFFNFCKKNTLNPKELLNVLQNKAIKCKDYFKSKESFDNYHKGLHADDSCLLEYNLFDEEYISDRPLNTYDIPTIEKTIQESLDIKINLKNNLPGLSGELTNNIFIEWVNKKVLKIKDSQSDIFQCPIDREIETSEELFANIVYRSRNEKEERSEKNEFFDVFDIKLKDSYTNFLARADYPIGNPTYRIYKNKTTKAQFTLGQILKRYKKQLVDGLYVIYVSGDLKKAQDLIISKYGLTPANIKSKISYSPLENSTDIFKLRLEKSVLLTTQQIELGVITSDVLKVLKAVCTNTELSDIYKLKVNLLVYYPQEKELSIDDWVEKYKDYKSINPSRLASRDLRSRDWCRFKLSEFLNPLLEKREEFKRLSEKDELYITKQKLLKLIINTVYGDLASPFFQMGNTIVANNITANVRTSVWLMSKALGTKITVTDGGFYEYKKVNFLKTHLKTFLKPSLNGLIKPTLHTSIGLKELVKDFDYKTCSREIIDELALKHIKDFWILYGIDFIAPIEHKYENCSISAYTSPYTKVDYVLNTYEGKKLVKIRGVKPSQILIHPKAEVLKAIEEGREINFQSAQLIEIMGISQYRKSVDKSVLPGHVYIVETNYRPNKNAPKLFPNYLKYKNSVYAYNERKSKYERDLLSDPNFGFFKG